MRVAVFFIDTDEGRDAQAHDVTGMDDDDLHRFCQDHPWWPEGCEPMVLDVREAKP